MKNRNNVFSAARAAAINNYYLPKKPKRKMATKKKPDERALIRKIVKAVVPKKNTVLPILEHVYLTGDQLQVSDIETSVIMPYKSGIEACFPADKFLDTIDMLDEPVFKCEIHGEGEQRTVAIEATHGKRKIKIMGENPDNFIRALSSEEYFELGELTEEHLKMMETALHFVSNDDLRPAMTGVYLADAIVSTDAHRLYWHPIDPLMDEFILSQKAVNILLKFAPTSWRVFGSAYHIVLMNDEGVIIETRIIDARFPDYKAVIPKNEDRRATLTVNPDVLRQELKNAIKFGNVTTNQVTFCLNGKVEVHSQDVDLSREYSNELSIPDEATVKFYQPDFIPIGTRVKVGDKPGAVYSRAGVNYTIQLDEYGDSGYNKKLEGLKRSDFEADDDLCVAFNGRFLYEVAAFLKNEPIEMQLWSPTKCTIINEHFLVMPLMLNS